MEPLPSNDKGILTEPLPSNDGGIHRHKQQRVLIFQNKESRLKIRYSGAVFYCTSRKGCL
jgi:hypothetical protein